jgi:hypothetical protein
MIRDPAAVRERLETIMNETEARNAELKRQIADMQESSKAEPGHRISEVIAEGDINLKIGDNKASRVARANSSYDAILSVFHSVCGAASSNIGYKTPLGRYAWIRNSFDVKFLFTLYCADNLTSLELVPLPPDLLTPLEKFNLRKEHAYRSRMPVFLVDCGGPDSALIWLSFPQDQSWDAATQTLKQIFGEFTRLSFVDDANDTVIIDCGDAWDYALATAGRIAPLGHYPLLVVQTAPGE